MVEKPPMVMDWGMVNMALFLPNLEVLIPTHGSACASLSSSVFFWVSYAHSRDFQERWDDQTACTIFDHGALIHLQWLTICMAVKKNRPQMVKLYNVRPPR